VCGPRRVLTAPPRALVTVAPESDAGWRARRTSSRQCFSRVVDGTTEVTPVGVKYQMVRRLVERSVDALANASYFRYSLLTRNAAFFAIFT
jgi:hypothetical protein